MFVLKNSCKLNKQFCLSVSFYCKGVQNLSPCKTIRNFIKESAPLSSPLCHWHSIKNQRGHNVINISQCRNLAALTAATCNAELPLENYLNSMRSKISQNHCVLKADIEKILTELTQQAVSQELCLFLLNCCKSYLPNLQKSERINLVKQIWTIFNTHGYTFKLEDLHAMLDIFTMVHQPLPEQLLLSSTKPDLFNDQGTQLRLLQCAAELGDLTSSAVVLGKMKQLGFPVGEDVFACLILGHGRTSDYPSVQSVVNTMRDAAVSWGPATFVALLQAQLENKQSIAGTLKQIEAHGVRLKEKHIVKLIQSIATSNRDNLLPMIVGIAMLENFSIEMKNCAVQLVHDGYPQLAVKLICETPAAFGWIEMPNSFAAFLSRTFVEANMKSHDILGLCSTLQHIFPHHTSFLLSATEASLRDLTKSSLASELLGHVSPLRNHFFWPLTVRAKDAANIANLLNRMQSLGLRVDFDTLAFYALPNIIKTDAPIRLLQYLQKTCNLSVSTLLGPFLHALVSSKMLNEAVTLCKQYKMRTLDLNRLAKPLVSMALGTNDLPSFVLLLELLAKSRHVFQKPVDVVGQFLVDYSLKCKPADLEVMLKLIQERKLSVSISSHEILSSRPSMRQFNQVLDAITNTRQEGTINMLPHPRDMSLEEMEGHLVELRAKNLNARGTLRRLLQLHCQQNNTQRVLEIKKELDAEGHNLSPGILASLFGLHLHTGDLKSGLAMLDQLSYQHPSFKIDEHKMLDLCRLMLQNGATQEKITTTLEEYEARCSKNGNSIRGGPGIVRNCDLLIKTSLELLGEDKSNNIKQCLKTLKFV